MFGSFHRGVAALSALTVLTCLCLLTLPATANAQITDGTRFLCARAQPRRCPSGDQVEAAGAACRRGPDLGDDQDADRGLGGNGIDQRN